MQIIYAGDSSGPFYNLILFNCKCKKKLEYVSLKLKSFIMSKVVVRPLKFDDAPDKKFNDYKAFVLDLITFYPYCNRCIGNMYISIYMIELYFVTSHFQVLYYIFSVIKFY